MTEKLYTLEEARQLLKEEECANFGHDFQAVYFVGEELPGAFICDNCGLTWGVTFHARK